MDRTARRRGFLVASLAVVFPLAVLAGAHSDDELPAPPPRAAHEPAADKQDLAEDIRQLRESIRELRDAIKTTPVAQQEEKTTPDDTADVKIFKLQVADVDDVVELLGLLPDVRFKVFGADRRLAVVAPAGQMQHVADVIAEADQLPRQIVISACIYDVPAEVAEQLDQGGQGAHHSSGLITRTVTDHDATTLLQALVRADGARLLGRPMMIISDKQEARFESVSEIPAQVVTKTQAGGMIGTTTFRDAGIKLRVTASLGDGQDILLDLNPEYSVLAGYVEGDESLAGYRALTGHRNHTPIIDRRSAETRVTLKSGEATVLRGLRRRTETESRTATSSTTKVVETELIIFLKAEVLDRARLAAASQDTRN